MAGVDSVHGFSNYVSHNYKKKCFVYLDCCLSSARDRLKYQQKHIFLQYFSCFSIVNVAIAMLLQTPVGVGTD